MFENIISINEIFTLKNILIYLLGINLIGFYMMWSDKRRAKWGKWRVPENTLFLITALGGGIGTISGMYTFRHKTKHNSFIVGFPIILVAQVVLLVYCIVKF